jgi:hypothetical protein
VRVPPGLDFYNGDTLGLKAIRNMGARISGDARFEADGGVVRSIAFRTSTAASGGTLVFNQS